MITYFLFAFPLNEQGSDFAFCKSEQNTDDVCLIVGLKEKEERVFNEGAYKSRVRLLVAPEG